MTGLCSQCGEAYLLIDATPEILAHTEGAEQFKETVEFLGGSLEGWRVGTCLTCNENVIQSSRITIEGTVE